MNTEEFLLNLVHWVEQWGYLAVFFGILIENAGIPAPGELMIIAGAIMAGKGAIALGVETPPLKIHLVYLWSVAGAIVGDNIGYWIGATGGRALMLRIGRVFGITAAKIAAAERAFAGRSEWTVFFGRFITLLRIFAGPLAGMIHMPYHRFVLFNASGAAIWVLAVAGLAYAFSEELDLIITILQRLGWIGLVIFVGLLIYVIWRRFHQRAYAIRSKRSVSDSEPIQPSSSG
ncbi:MAG: DedA family protein [Cyanobacteria bacterium NC_groundwater_1444_Ag_S-0.65um_54_12]|nr:DedA family protein [Cyanobacteria bacterium NC_groundwater_1444_Ag_S-0.65um_54_12]